MNRIAFTSCGLVGFAVLIMWTVRTSAQQGPFRFDVASVRLNMTMPDTPTVIGVLTEDEGSLNYRQIGLRRLLMRAYDVGPERVVGPAWMDQFLYDVVANFPSGATKANIPEMLEDLLADRFGMMVHKEFREGPAYDLVVAKGGLKLKPTDLDPESRLAKSFRVSPNGHLAAKRFSSLALLLTTLVERPVFDRTGVTGTFDIEFQAALEDLPKLNLLSALTQSAGASDQRAPSLVAALGDLGLALVSRRAELEYLVVDKAEKLPTAN